MNMQLGLRLSGDYDGAIDGIWGPGSKAALIEFQKRHA
jgi:peptidoglycan hydrolase-like protein with peptidoglycan-binding domain